MSHSVPPGSITMCEWNIVKIETKEKTYEKFLGFDILNQRYRISSMILQYDPSSNSGETLSGSEYHFLDKPGQLHPKAHEIYEELVSIPSIKVSLKYPFIGSPPAN